MESLHAFLHPEQPENQKIVISNRFKDESGEVVPFEIKALNEEETESLRKRAMIAYRSKTGVTESKLDAAKLTRLLVIAGTVRPDFRAKELCDAYGVIDPEQVLGKMLLAGEYAKLSDAILNLSGMGDDVEIEAKNSLTEETRTQP